MKGGKLVPPGYRQRPNIPFQQWGAPQRNPWQPSPFGRPNRFQGMNGMSRMNGFQRQRSGGLLSRLLGGRGGFQQMGSANPFQFGSGMQMGRQAGVSGMLNPGNISKFLGQTQQVLRTAQQVGPMIQQYGPLIRNLPALWKIYKGMNSSTDSEEETELNLDHIDEESEESKDHEIVIESEEEKLDKKDQKKPSDDSHLKTTPKKKRPLEPKPSIPKLFI